jgi:hypothetical protein
VLDLQSHQDDEDPGDLEVEGVKLRDRKIPALKTLARRLHVPVAKATKPDLISGVRWAGGGGGGAAGG